MASIILRRSITVMLSALSIGCGGDSSGPATPASFAGKWLANGTVSGGGSFVMEFELAQTGASATGPASILGGFGGTISGTVAGNKLTFTLTPGSSCTGAFNGTMTINAAATQISGSMNGTSTCTGTITSSSFVAGKQPAG